MWRCALLWETQVVNGKLWDCCVTAAKQVWMLSVKHEEAERWQKECFLSAVTKLQVPVWPQCLAQSPRQSISTVFLLANDCYQLHHSWLSYLCVKMEPIPIRSKGLLKEWVDRNSTPAETVQCMNELVPLCHLSFEMITSLSLRKKKKTPAAASSYQKTQWHLVALCCNDKSSPLTDLFLVLLSLTEDLPVKMLLVLHMYVLLSVLTCVSVCCSDESWP